MSFYFSQDPKQKVNEGGDLQMSDNILVRHSSIVVPDYTPGDSSQIEKMLSIWDKVNFKVKTPGLQYDEESQTLYLPRGMDVSYIEHLLQRRAKLETDPDPHSKASIRLKTEPRDDIQIKSIAFLIGEGKFKTKQSSQLVLNLMTGHGKSYTTIAGLSFMKTKAMILTHAESIKEQWRKSFINMTDILDEQILNVDGSKTIRMIMKLKGEPPWKIFLVNRRTIQSYAKKEGWDAVHEFFKKIKIGVKVYDEAHIEFETMMHIDFHSNTKKTIYLTATFERSEHEENRVFKNAFKNVPKYGIESRIETERHIVYVPVMYNSNPSFTERGMVKGRMGFNKNKFCDLQMESDTFFDTLKWTIDALYKDNSNKLLIMTSKIASTEVVAEFIKKEYPQYTCGVYNSSMSDEEKKKTLEMDIISSTPKSLGTGNDIPGLRFIINAEQYASSVQADQTAGRLRSLGAGIKTFYVELVDEGYTDCVRLYKKRLPVFKKKCVDIMKIRPNA